MNIEITELDVNNLELLKEALNMMNKTQGEGLFNEDYLIKKANSSDAIVLCAFLNNKLVSVGAAEIISNFDYYKPFENNIAERLKEKKAGDLTEEDIKELRKGLNIIMEKSDECCAIVKPHKRKGIRHV